MKKVCPLFVVLFFSFIAGELAIRIVSHKKKISIIETLKYSNQLRPPSTSTTPFPLHHKNKNVKIMGHDIRTNSLGLRGPEINNKNSKTRILSIGSSVSLGWGVSEEESFAKKIEKISPNFEVINAGIANTNSQYQFEVLKKLLPLVNPDIVLLNYFLYDSRDRSQITKNTFLKNSFLGTYLYSWILNLKSSMKKNESIFDYFKKTYRPNSPLWQKSLLSVKKMSDLSSKESISFIVMIYPELHDLSQSSPVISIYNFIETEFKKLGIPTIDKVHQRLSNYSGKERQLWVSPTDPHGNSVVQDVIAETFIEWHKKTQGTN